MAAAAWEVAGPDEPFSGELPASPPTAAAPSTPQWEAAGPDETDPAFVARGTDPGGSVIDRTLNKMGDVVSNIGSYVKGNVQQDLDVLQKGYDMLPSKEAQLGKVAGSTLTTAGGLTTLAANALTDNPVEHADRLDEAADKYEQSGFYHGNEDDKAHVKALRDAAQALRGAGIAQRRQYYSNPDEAPFAGTRAAGENLTAAGKAILDETQPTHPNAVERTVLGVEGAAPTLAAGAVGGILGGPAAALSAMGAAQAGDTYASVDHNPALSESQKEDFSLASAGISTVFNAVPVTKAIGPAGSAVTRFLSSLAINVPAQEANVIAQHALAQKVGTDGEWDDKQWGQAVLDAALQAGVMSGAHAMASIPMARRAAAEQAMSPEAQAKARAEMFPEPPPEPAPVEPPSQLGSGPSAPSAAQPTEPVKPAPAAPTAAAKETPPATISETPESSAAPSSLEALEAIKKGTAHPLKVMQAQKEGLVSDTGTILPAGRRRIQALNQSNLQAAVTPETKPADVTVINGKDAAGNPAYGVAVHGTAAAWYDSPTTAKSEVTALQTALPSIKSRLPPTTHEVLGQPVTVNTNPTPAQTVEGNYKKGSVQWQGRTIKIENPAGSVRSGVDDAGTPWKRKQAADYGYFSNTQAKDGDHVDVYIGKNPQADKAYVVDQLTPDGKQYDEAKVVIGVDSKEDATALYRQHYGRGWKGLGAITEMSLPEFHKYLDSDATKSPVAWKEPGTAVDTRYRENEALLKNIASQSGWYQKGGQAITDQDEVNPKVTGRTKWIAHSPEWADAQSVAPLPGNTSGAATKEAVRKAIAGEKLNAAESRHVNALISAEHLRLENEKRFEDLDKINDQELTARIAELEARAKGIEETEDQREARMEREAIQVEEPKKTYSTKQPDLFSDKVAVKNELARLEAEKDRRRNSGQESVETGKPDDLFSESRKQTDLTQREKNTLPTSEEVLTALKEHPFTKLNIKPKRVFVAGSFATGKQRPGSDLDVVLEVGSEKKAAQLQEQYRNKVATYFLKNDIRGVHDEVHPQWKGRRIDVYFVGDAEREKNRSQFVDIGKSNEQQTDTTEFKKWFGESKVIDSSGKPLVVYHGTDKKFKSFNTKKTTQGIHWFTSDKSAVESGNVGAQGRGQVMDLYASIKKPAGWKEYEKYSLGELKGLGYDGALLPDPDGSVTGFVFDPKQLKSTHNKGNFDSTKSNIVEESHSKYERPLWRSALTEAAQSAKREKGTGKEWLNTLRNMPGVKQEEIDATDLAEFLGDRKGVTKQEVTDYLHSSGVQVTETTLGKQSSNRDLRVERSDDINGTFRVVDSNDSVLLDNVSERNADDFVDAQHNGDTTKFKKYTTPGGKNYRELLLQLPRQQIDITKAVRQKPNGDWAWFVGKQQAGAPFPTEMDARVGLKSVYKNIQDILHNTRFDSSHWNEPNVIAHLRFDERDVGGKRVMHIAEVQSDWHQKGRKQGYATSDRRATSIERNEDGYWHVNDQFGQFITNVIDRQMNNPDDTSEALRIANSRLVQSDVGRTSYDTRVPDAPFKNTWHELAMKRAIRWAADHDIDRITWDTGKTQADRYDLSKQVEAVYVEKDTDGTFMYDAQAAGDSVMDGRANDVNALADIIGKELAEKADKLNRGENKTYRGDDLKVGGAGMRGFYDKILPATVNKLIKKHGSSVKLNAFHVGATSKQPELDTLGPMAHGFDITPQMRDAALQGMAVFEHKLMYAQPQLPLGDPYDNFKTREGTTAAQLDLGRSALADIESRIFGTKNTGLWQGASVLGSAVSKGFRDTGHITLVGQQIKTAKDLAIAAQVLRNPFFETFRTFYVDNDNHILGEHTYGSNMPGFAMLPPGLVQFSHMQADMKRLGATGYHILHNHPSGIPTPSQADVNVTAQIARYVKGFKSHVVIDHNAYGLVEMGRDGFEGKLVAAPWLNNANLRGTPELAHPVLGAKASDPDQVAAALKHIQVTKETATILATTGHESRIAFAMELPIANLIGLKSSMSMRRAMVAVKRALAATGVAGNVFAVIPRDTHPSVVAALNKLNVFTDITDENGKFIGSSYQMELGRSLLTHRGRNGLTGEMVRETTAGYDDLMDERDRLDEERDRRRAMERSKLKPDIGTKPDNAYEVARRIVTAIPQSEFLMSFRRAIDPTGVSADSKAVASLLRSNLGHLAHDKFEAIQNMERYAADIDKLSPKDQLQIMDDIEQGRPQSVKGMQPAANAMRQMFDEWRDKVRGLGDGYLDTWIENYFPHYWQDTDKAKSFIGMIAGRRPLRGPATFLKKRSIPTIKEGMSYGLKPLTINPLIMSALKVHEMQRFYAGVKLMQEFKAQGLARFLRSGQPTPEGWTEIKDAVGRVRSWSEAEKGFIERGKYIMPVDGARVINNHLSASAFRNFLPAQVFRATSNMLNALQLGFSGFHLGFTTLDAVISKNAIGIERLAHGEPLRAAAAFVEAATGPGAAAMNLYRGMKLLRAYSNISGATPEMQAQVSMLMHGGGRVSMDRYFMAAQGVSPFHGVGFYTLAKDVRAALSQPTNQLSDAGKAIGSFPLAYATKMLRDLQAMGKTYPMWELPFEIAGRITRASTALIMEKIVPLQKLGVFSDMAADYLRRNPTASPPEAMAAMQSAWQSVDNRLGEMTYDNLAWNRTFKDSLHFGVRAVGWNYGTLSEIGGAPVDVLKFLDKGIREKKFSAADIGHKIPYVLAMTATTMVLGAILCKLFTGMWPKEAKDYYFPPTGGVTKYGTKERVSLPSYAKDVYEYSQEPGQTFLNKLNPIFSVTTDIWQNEDYFGNAIYDPEASDFDKAKQTAKFLVREATPFSLQGGKQLYGSEQPGAMGAFKSMLPMIGVNPAPGRVTSTDQMETARVARKEQSYAQGLKYRMKQAQQAGDTKLVEELKHEYMDSKKRARALGHEAKQNKAAGQKAQRGQQSQPTTSLNELGNSLNPITDKDSKSHVVAALHSAGTPALASLIESMPLKMRPTVAMALRENV